MPALSIIFDLDGTLLDTLADIAETANAVLAHHGFPIHNLDEYKVFVGDGLQVLIQKIVPKGTEANIQEDCRRLFLRFYAEAWSKNSRPYDGITEMLGILSEMGISMAVLSNKPDTFTKLFVAKYFPGNLFNPVYGQREGFAKKPDPAVALSIAESLGQQPRDILFVGDTGIDIRTGKASGMGTAAVSWGFRGIEELQKEQPDTIINHPMELVHYVRSLT
jgi:phosphoglycolate phosphatase